jgi:myo-inositol-1(or 4)-monophosphatase
MPKEPMDELDDRFHAGCAAVLAGGRLARRHFDNRDQLQVEVKGPQDHASIADREVEQLIVNLLAGAFAADRFFGEEGGGQTGDSLWVIDPIDGTTNFLHGLPSYCVSLAYMRDGVVELGMIYHPPADELFAARRGRGATCNGAAIRVSGCTNLTDALVGVGFSYRRPVRPFIEATARLLEAHCEVRRDGAGALAMAQVAAGRLDGYWEQHINSWDVLAGLLLVQEAGGWTNDFLSGNALLEGNPILACTPALREPLCTLTGMR